jgi:selenocysteine-specific elongation factor
VHGTGTRSSQADEHLRTAILRAIAGAGIAGATPAEIRSVTEADDLRITTEIAALLAHGRLRPLTKPEAYIAIEIADGVIARVREHLRGRQTERPWLMGVTSLALAQMLSLPEPALIRVLHGFVETGALAYRGGYYSTPEFTPQLSAEQRAFFDTAFASCASEPQVPLAFAELRARIKSSPIAELTRAFETLVASGTLSKVGDFVYRGSQITAIREQLEAVLRRQGTVTVAEFRTLTGTSRKYAVPLLEFFDAAGLTQRLGDVRVLRGGKE